MVKRNPVSVKFNKWNDAQRVDQPDMVTEQNYNIQTNASIISNHFGSGVLPDSIEQSVLFDTDELTADQAALVVSNDFDGTGMDAHVQPSDLTLGNQISVELTGADVFGRFSTKVLIIGLDFQGNPQFDRFTFFKNEVQVTKKHYTRILTIFFNDFKGNNMCSRNRGGRVVIREAASYELSRDPIMVAQDVEPDLFFRDFKISGLINGGNPSVTLYTTLQAGMGPEYSVDALNIQTTVKQNRFLMASDVVTKIGQKFQATTNNIQKATLLLGVSANTSAPIDDKFDWSGDLVINIYELQTSVSCPSDTVPQLAIDFDPNPEPVAQLSLSQSDLRDMGYVLTDVLQPVDFIFSDTQLGSTINAKIVPERYYAVTMNRAGSANVGNIFTGVANSRIENSRLTMFSGSWVDVTEEDLWFQIWQDAAKVADGQAYDDGNGIEIPQVIENETGAIVDYSLDAQAFSDTGESTLNTAVVQAIAVSSQEEQDERTGNPVFSRQQFEPRFSFVTNSELADLKETDDPLIIGCAEDTNPKLNPVLDKIQDLPGLVNGDVFTIVNPDPDLLSLKLIGSKLIPNSVSASLDYRIFRVKICTDGYGDVNGDGIIGSDDIARAAELVGESLLLDSTQQKIVDGYISTLEMLRADVDGDGYITVTDVTLITQYVARTINAFPVGSSFTHLELQVQQSIGRFDGYYDCTDGYIRLNGSAGGAEIYGPSLSQTEKEYYGFTETPNMNGADVAFTTVPFVDVPFEIRPIPWWQDYLLAFSSDARLVPAAFTFDERLTSTQCQTIVESCVDLVNVTPTFDPGRNDIMFPNNLIMRSGQILNPDGTNYKVDLEINHIILELPAEPFEEAVIDVLRKLVADAGDGFTSAGYPAQRFSDCSTVGVDALAKSQVKFGVAVQAFNPNLDGYEDGYGYGIIVDDVIGVYMDQTTGLLTLTIKDLDVDPIFFTMVTKIEITVYLKKAGWNNPTLIVPSNQIMGLLA